MDATVEQLGGVVIDALRAAGYKESTIGQYEKTVRYLKGFVADRGEVVYAPWLGAEFAAMTTSPRTGRFSAQRRFDIRDFGRWLQIHGDAEAYVLSDRWKAGVVPAHPYLLRTEEVEAFFTAATHLHAQSPWQWQALAFFTLMHSCGIRTGEVRALRTAQVDLHDQQVDIIWAKGNRSRRLPITAQVADVLAACDRASRQRFTTRETFFVSARGNPVTTAAVGVIFNRIWDQAGLPRPAEGTRPRPYDFRHHFAYANIERWMTHGKDVNTLRSIPGSVEALKPVKDESHGSTEEVQRGAPAAGHANGNGCTEGPGSSAWGDQARR